MTGRITVASFDFPESELIADLYAGALRAAGFDVRHDHRIGTREVVLPALQLGLVEVVPEYSGSAVEFLGGRSSADAATVERTLDRLVAARGIDALEPAPAQSRNGLVVTSETADEARAPHDQRPPRRRGHADARWTARVPGSRPLPARVPGARTG